jgi:ATP phosphoribosyltransferase
MEHIADISSRLVVNKASMKTKHARIETFIKQIREAVREKNNG